LGTYRIGVLYGDGIGPEIVRATVDVLMAAAERVGETKFDWVELPMGFSGIKECGDAVPEITKKSLEACDGWIMGPNDSAAYPQEYKDGKRAPSGELRHHFDLYANIRPNKTMAGIRSVIGDADLVIVRENIEGFYPDRNMYAGGGEFMVTPEIALCVGVFTKKAAKRIAHAAFRMAANRRKRVTIVHKANVIKLGFGLFLDTCREVAKEYPEIVVDDYHMDAFTAHLVRRAGDFDVIVTENMFGDILSDLAGELVGSLGLSPSLNAGDDKAMAQAAHGSAPDIAGENIANPVGEMLSAVMLIDWLSNRHDDERLREVGRLIETAIMNTLAEGVRTPDLGGDATTTQFTQAIIQRI
jgi:3-isopropylmalate dehydrogenase